MKVSSVSINTKPTYYAKRRKNKELDGNFCKTFPSLELPNYQISFGNKNQVSKITESIEKNLAQKYNMQVDFAGNELIAECVNKTIKLFEECFGAGYLPNKVAFIPFSSLFPKGYNTDNVLGIHTRSINTRENEVDFNSEATCYKSLKNLKLAGLSAKLRGFNPTSHYLQTFIHEFGHSAHYKHLEFYNRGTDMDMFRKQKMPNIFSEFLVKFSLSRYSATNMNEFMAERITKDLSENIDDNCNFIGNEEDIDYSNIFANRWDNELIAPQALLDKLTQEELEELLEELI